MRDRALLHVSKLDRFAEWAIAQGYVREQTKGVFEVLRLRKPDGHPVIFYTRNDAKEHVTAHGAGYELVRRWLRTRAKGAPHA